MTSPPPMPLAPPALIVWQAEHFLNTSAPLAGSADASSVAIGTSAAWGLSTYLLLVQYMAALGPADHGGHAPHLYYEASAVLITFILLAVGVTVVALGIGKGGFEMAIGNNGGAGNIVKAVAIGGLIASGLAIAVWAVGNALTTTTIPGLSG